MKTDQPLIETNNKQALNLIDDWCADVSGYDDSVWVQVKDSVESNRISERKRFDDSSDAGHGTIRQDNTSQA